jgi:large subunit ribosomal protein L35
LLSFEVGALKTGVRISPEEGSAGLGEAEQTRLRSACHFPDLSLISAPSNRPASRWAAVAVLSLVLSEADRRLVRNNKGPRAQESKMPKLKTKSGAKKRFKITGTGKVIYAQKGKRHGMIKRTNKQIRSLRGTAVLFKTDGDNVKKYFLPNG